MGFFSKLLDLLGLNVQKVCHYKTISQAEPGTAVLLQQYCSSTAMCSSKAMTQRLHYR
jgi:hypothetical protein